MAINTLIKPLRDLRQNYKATKKLHLEYDSFIYGNWFSYIDEQQGYLIRSNNTVTPLLCGEKTFAEIHQEILKAKHTVHIALWSMLPGFRLIRGQASEQHKGYRSIGDLLLYVAKRNKNLKIRIMLWSIRDQNVKGGKLHNPKLEASQAFLKGDPYYREDLLWFNSKVKKYKNIEVKFQHKTHLAYSHHQKFIIIDSKVGFCMGKNMRTADWDTCDNKLYNPNRDPSQVPRYDISAKVTGPAVADLEWNFLERWIRRSRERDRKVDLPPKSENNSSTLNIKNYPAIIEWVPSLVTGELDVSDFDTILKKRLPALTFNNRNVENGVIAQVSRTYVTAPLVGWTGKHDPTEDHSILSMYKNAIASAQFIIHIENQYFRYSDLANAIANRVNAKEGNLYTLLVLGLPGGPVDRGLTNRSLKIVSDAYAKWGKQDNFKVLCLATSETSENIKKQLVNQLKQKKIYAIDLEIGFKALYKDDKKLKAIFDTSNKYLYDTPLTEINKKKLIKYLKENKANKKVIYKKIDAHVKSMIIDDSFYTIGSANFNKRSMLHDSEINISVLDPKQAHTFRYSLLQHHLSGIKINQTSLLNKKPNDDGIPKGIVQYFELLTKTAEKNSKIVEKEKETLQGKVALFDTFNKPGPWDWLENLFEKGVLSDFLEEYVHNDINELGDDDSAIA